MTSIRKKYEASEVTTIDAQLKELPANTQEKKLSTRAVVERLSATIYSLLDHGYSINDVQEFLAVSNVDIAASTLRRYLSDMEKRVKDSQQTPQGRVIKMRRKITKNISAENVADIRVSADD